MYIDYEDDITSLYKRDLSVVVDQENLDKLIAKWKDVLGWGDSFQPEYKPLDDYRDKPQYTQGDEYYLELLAPLRLLRLELLSKEYGLPTGAVYRQLFSRSNV